MWFWMAVLTLATAAVLGISHAAARAARRAEAPGEDATVAVHRRQLGEIDDLARRGLLGVEERRAAEAEAGRRLLSAVDRAPTSWSSGGRHGRQVITGAAVAAVAGALALYLTVGAPGLRDQPYAARLAGWRAADPGALAPEQMTAVLVAATRERPRDPRGFEFLGRAQMAAGDPASAALSFSKAAGLAPGSAELRAEVGEALVTAAEGKVTPDASAAFHAALTLDPTQAAARYYLARERIAGGDRGGGLADWRALAASLPQADPRRGALIADIGRVAAGGPPQAPPASSDDAAPNAGSDQAGFIRGMVASLAARLEARPDDPDGWARLVRSYGVLGDAPARAKALQRARALFKDQPAALAKVEAEAR